MFWDKPKTTWNKLTYSLVTYWYQPPSIKKILDPPLNTALHFSESAGSPVRICHCLSRQLASHSSFQYSVNCPSSPSNWPAHLPVKQKYIWPYHGGPQLSRQNQKPHGKNKNITAKPKTSRQNQILHSKSKIALVLPWVFAFSVRFSVLPWGILFLPWGFWFCRDSCGPPYWPPSSFYWNEFDLSWFMRQEKRCLFALPFTRMVLYKKEKVYI